MSFERIAFSHESQHVWKPKTHSFEEMTLERDGDERLGESRDQIRSGSKQPIPKWRPKRAVKTRDPTVFLPIHTAPRMPVTPEES